MDLVFLRRVRKNKRRAAASTVEDWQGLQQLEPRLLLSGATAELLTLSPGDVGSAVAVTAAATPANHAPTGTVTISGTAKEDETLTASNDLADEDGIGENSDSRLDVLVVYPQSAEQQMQYMINWGRNWGETDLDLFLAAVFAQTTGIYRDSGVDVTFNVVHSEQIDFSHIDADWQVDLSSALMNSESSMSYVKPYIDEIEVLRSNHSADIVVYWRQFQDGGPRSNGAGSIGGGDDEAYMQLTYGGMNPAIVAHESGHLLSGEHGDGVQESAFYTVNGDAPKLREYRTIMTTAVSLGLDQYNYLWRFSDADAMVTGDVTCSELNGSPKMCSFEGEALLGNAMSDVVPKLSSMVPVMAAFRLASGDGIGGIGYQWNRNGTAIDGASGTTYTLTQDDVGSTITVTASYIDGGGTAEHVTSAATAVVAEADVPVVLGDVNNDGQANNLDVTPFIAALQIGGSIDDLEQVAAFLAQVPGGSFANSDANTNGLVNNLDITPFISLLAQSGSAANALHTVTASVQRAGPTTAILATAAVRRAPLPSSTQSYDASPDHGGTIESAGILAGL